MAKPAQTVAELAARIAAAGPASADEREYRHALRGEELRHSARGNGGPALDEPEPRMRKLGAAEVLRLGELLWGDRHTTDLARVCAEDPGEVRRWRRGERAGPGRVAAWAIRREAVERIALIQAGIERLDAVYPPGIATEPSPEAGPAPAATATIPLGAITDPQVDLEAWIKEHLI